MQVQQEAAHTAAMERIIDAALAEAGGWLGFDRFMNLALYAPGVGYYSGGLPKFGMLPQTGSDFATAPEMSACFGRLLAVQVEEALDRTGTRTVYEFGAGSGALAEQLLQALGDRVAAYQVVDLSGSLRERQQAKLGRFGERVRWLSSLPEQMEGVVVGNELLDAMPVRLLARQQGAWHERGVVRVDRQLAWADRSTGLRPPVEVPGTHGYLTETHDQARAFIASLAARLVRGAAFFIDYGFPEAEYYHPQRAGGTLACHRGHLVDFDPLEAPGAKDITAHVDFTGIALAGQSAGLEVLGYTSQARFLFNLGIADELAAMDLPSRAMALRLVHEHEMGELFKVIGFCAGPAWEARGFCEGDRSHTL